MTPAPIRAATGNGTAVRSGFGSVRTTGVDGSSAGSRGYGRTATDVAGRRRRRVFVGEARSGGWSGSGGAVRVWLSGAVGAAAGESTLRWETPREGTPRSGVPLPPARGTPRRVTPGESRQGGLPPSSQETPSRPPAVRLPCGATSCDDTISAGHGRIDARRRARRTRRRSTTVKRQLSRRTGDAHPRPADGGRRTAGVATCRSPCV